MTETFDGRMDRGSGVALEGEMGTRLYQEIPWSSGSRRDRPGAGARRLVMVLLALFVFAPVYEARAAESHHSGAERRVERGGHGSARGGGPTADETEVLGKIIVHRPPLAPLTGAPSVQVVEVIITSLALGMSGAGAYACARSLWEGRRAKGPGVSSLGDTATEGRLSPP